MTTVNTINLLLVVGAVEKQGNQCYCCCSGSPSWETSSKSCCHFFNALVAKLGLVMGVFELFHGGH